MSNGSKTEDRASSLSDIVGPEGYEKLQELERNLRDLVYKAQGEYDARVRKLYDEMAQKLVKRLADLKKSGQARLDTIMKEFFRRLDEARKLMDKFLSDSKRRLEEAEQQVWKEYTKVEEWWEKERAEFGKTMSDVFDAVVGAAGIGEEDYKRVALVPTNYDLQVESSVTGSKILRVAGAAFDAAEWAVKLGLTIVNPTLGTYLLNSDDIDTRVLFYRTFPPRVNPWDHEDDRVDKHGKPYDPERPLEFPISLPMSTIIPITFVRGLETDVFEPLEKDVQKSRGNKRKRTTRKTMLAVQFLFSDRLYDDTNWIWLFLDPLDYKQSDEVERYGFGWYLQGRFFPKNRRFRFSIENRLFIDTIHMDFKNKAHTESAGSLIAGLEPNYTNYTEIGWKTGSSGKKNGEYVVKAKFHANAAGMVGRKVEVEAGVSAEAQVIVKLEIGVSAKVQFPDTLVKVVHNVGQEMIDNGVLESAKKIQARLEASGQNFLETFRSRCNHPGCSGSGEPIAWVEHNGEYVRQYKCDSGLHRFRADQADRWDNLVSGGQAIGHFAAALAHYAHAVFKTNWAILEVLAREVTDKEAELGVAVGVSPGAGTGVGGIDFGAEVNLNVKVFELVAPVDVLNSKQDREAMVELAGRIFVGIGQQIYEELKPRSESVVAWGAAAGRMLNLARSPEKFVVYFLKAVAPALAGMPPKHAAWVNMAYEKVKLSIGVGLGGKVLESAGQSASAGISASVGLECNLAAFCKESAGKVNSTYELSAGTAFGFKGGFTIPNPYVVTAKAEVGIAFPLKTHSILLEAPEPLFL